MDTASSQKQDRSYYKSLYHFNADVELAEYSLPVLSNQQQPTKDSQKLASGAINTTQLPPIQQQSSSMTEKVKRSGYDEEYPIDEEDEELGMDQVDERDEDIEEAEMEDYDEVR